MMTYYWVESGRQSGARIWPPIWLLNSCARLQDSAELLPVTFLFCRCLYLSVGGRQSFIYSQFPRGRFSFPEGLSPAEAKTIGGDGGETRHGRHFWVFWHFMRLGLRRRKPSFCGCSVW